MEGARPRGNGTKYAFGSQNEDRQPGQRKQKEVGHFNTSPRDKRYGKTAESDYQAGMNPVNQCMPLYFF